MNMSIEAMTGPLTVISLVALGVLLFVTILRSLRESSLFGSGSAAVLAACVTILALLGVHEFFVAPGRTPDSTPTPSDTDIDHNGGDLLLLPYAALAVAILLSLLLLSAGRIIQGGKPKRPDEVSERHMRKVRPHGQTDEQRRFR